jgi:hypothetical protein
MAGMSLDSLREKRGDLWIPYRPDPGAPWNLRRVVHLRRRAGFGATWREIQRDLADGPMTAVDRLLAGRARLDGLPDDFERVARLLADSAHDPDRLKAWWMFRMLRGPDPLTERLTLMWHNHFATSGEKVELRALRRQNELFRTLARAPFGDLLKAVVHDPALLDWLDAPTNRKGHPNENLGRELMELFTLGIGHYTEADVKQGSRALTGWTIADGAFREDHDAHDDGEKSILGRVGRWTGDDLVRMLLDHPATSQRLALRLCEQFMGEDAVGPGTTEELAAGLRERQLDVGWAVETILRSKAFFAEPNLGTRVLGPVEYVVGAARVLEPSGALSGTTQLADRAARFGQDLFFPPNVGGWTAGRDWISPRAMIARANFAAALVAGDLSRRKTPLDPAELLQRCDGGETPERAVERLSELFLGADPAPAFRDRLLASASNLGVNSAEVIRKILTLLLASPEAQLC